MTLRSIYRAARWVVLVVLLVVLGGVLYLRLPRPVNLEVIAVPPGFAVAAWATGIEDARSLALGEAGTVFVGTRNAGVVYALRDEDGDHAAERVDTVATGLHMPNGVDVLDGDLYVAEVTRVLRFDSIESRLDAPPPGVSVIDGLPAETWHGWRYARFGPDGMLYIAIGVPCNICLEEAEPRFGTILRADVSTGETAIVARGVRNSVGFDWHPETGNLWFTDNGRDWLGDDAPPDELNRLTEPDQHFGFPYCHGGSIQDEQFDSRSCDQFIPPVELLGPHVAALGMRFYRGSMFPSEYRGRVFIAEHGSWNRIVPIGYRITTVSLDRDRSIGYDVFADGWLARGRSSGTPVDLLELADGSLLVSDDRAGMIYRISYAPED